MPQKLLASYRPWPSAPFPSEYHNSRDPTPGYLASQADVYGVAGRVGGLTAERRPSLGTSPAVPIDLTYVPAFTPASVPARVALTTLSPPLHAALTRLLTDPRLTTELRTTLSAFLSPSSQPDSKKQPTVAQLVASLAPYLNRPSAASAPTLKTVPVTTPLPASPPSHPVTSTTNLNPPPNQKKPATRRVRPPHNYGIGKLPLADGNRAGGSRNAKKGKETEEVAAGHPQPTLGTTSTLDALSDTDSSIMDADADRTRSIQSILDFAMSQPTPARTSSTPTPRTSSTPDLIKLESSKPSATSCHLRAPKLKDLRAQLETQRDELARSFAVAQVRLRDLQVEEAVLDRFKNRVLASQNKAEGSAVLHDGDFVDYERP